MNARIRSAAGLTALALALASGLVLPTTSAAADEGVDVSVTIDDLTPPGSLAMTVAANNGVALTENGSDAVNRQFTGTLPVVTVSDTRSTAEIPAGSRWSVVGQASAFTAPGVDPIGAEYLGWTPKFATTPAPADDVEVGDQIASIVDATNTGGAGGPTTDSGLYAGGLEGQELLVSTDDAATGSWDVTADLALRVPADTAAGEYTSVVTLSLFDN